MFFFDDRPYKGTRPADLDDEGTDRAGFADPLGNVVTVAAWVFIVFLIAYLTWAHEVGALPLWG